MLTFAVHLLIVVPARIGSSRLREKPLCLLGGEPLIRHVCRNVRSWHLDASVVVATDDVRVRNAVVAMGVDAVMTGVHRCGTERVAEVVARWRSHPVEVVLNVQGDEPFLPRDTVVDVIDRVRAGEPIMTAGAPLSAAARTDRHRVKVVVDGPGGRALRFSRDLPASVVWPCAVEVQLHVGVYAYTRAALARWVALAPTEREMEEGLEQLRPLEYGIPIGVAKCAAAPLSIDTEMDLQRADVLSTGAEAIGAAE